MVSAQLPLATLGHKNDFRLGRSPGLVVMGGDSRLKGCGFESRHRILDGHFSHRFVVKICNVCLKRPKIYKKRPVLAHFLKNDFRLSYKRYHLI